MNLTRQLHGNIAREWFQTSNLIQSRQIQNKENVKTNVPFSAHGQLQYAQSGAVESKHSNIYILITYELSSVEQTCDVWNRAVPLPCSTADPVEFNCCVELHSSLLNWMISNVAPLPWQSRINSIKWVRHGSSTTFETGLSPQGSLLKFSVHTWTM